MGQGLGQAQNPEVGAESFESKNKRKVLKSYDFRTFYGTREHNGLKQKSSRNEIRYDYSIWLRRQDSNFKFVKHLEYSVHFRILISFF